MFLNQQQIDGCIGWLLENASPAVKWLTYKNLLKTDPAAEPMPGLWNSVEKSADASAFFSRQNQDGSWFSGGSWGAKGYRQQTGPGYTISRPKFVTTAWILPFLGEMGFTAQNEQVQKACERMLAEIQYPAAGAGSKVDNCCGLFAIPLRAFASVGMGADGRLEGGWEQLLHCQRADGGWLNPNHLADSPTPSKTKGRWPWSRSCAWGTSFATQALYYSGRKEHQQALSRALEFLLWHLSQNDEADIQTWVYHGHNTVKDLLMFSESGIDMRARPIQALLNWLKDFYQPAEGMFRTQEKPIPEFTQQITAIIEAYKELFGTSYWDETPKASSGVLRYQLYHLIEDDWLTYTLTRIAQNLLTL